MQLIRILIVDDSAVIRKVLSHLLSSDPEIVVVGTAGNGHQALARIPETKPDLVTLDIEMPGMDGLETLVEIRKLYPRLPVIMFSTLTERGATATLDALARRGKRLCHQALTERRIRDLARARAGGVDSEDQVFVPGARSAAEAPAAANIHTGLPPATGAG